MKPSRHYQSLTRRLILHLSLVVTLAAFSSSVLLTIYVARGADRDLKTRADTAIEHLRRVLEKPLWDLDAEAVKAIGRSLEWNDHYTGFRCVDDQGTELYAFLRGNLEDSLHKHAVVAHGGVTVGKVDLYLSREPFNEAVRRVAYTASAVNALILLTISLAAGFIARRQLRKPLVALEQFLAGYLEGELSPAEGQIPYREFEPFESVLLDMRRRLQGHLGDLRALSEQLETRNAELAEANQLQQMIFDQAFQFFGLIAPDGIVLRANQTALEFIGRDAQEVLGKYFWDTPWWTQNAEQQARLREAVGRAANGEVVRFETSNLDAQGLSHAVDFSIKPVLDASRDIVYLIAEGRDITESLKAKADLQEIKERYRILYESAGDAIVIMNEDLIVDCNEKALEMFGCERDQLIGQSPIHFSPPLQPCGRDSSALALEKIRLAREGKAQSFEWTHARLNGTTFEAEVSLNAIRIAKDVLLQAFVRDISERKRAEAQREDLQLQLRQAQKLEAIGTLAGGIAHDFNNILGAIIGHAQLLQYAAEQGRPLDAASVDEVLLASHRARDLVRQILTFSQRSKSQKQPVRLDLIAQEALKLLRRALPVIIDIRLNTDLSAGTIFADATHMHQVVMNLCTNAAHAMGEEGGVLDVKLRVVKVEDPVKQGLLTLPPGIYQGLTVSDTGCGIPPENMERIFDPFFTTKGQGEGTGLGLAVVHGIVHDHLGEIAVKSEVGAGTTFRILLPLLSVTEAVSKPKKALSELPHGNERILVVDDEEPLLQIASKILVSLGYEVVVRDRAASALDLILIDREHFDLVITDLMMPKMTGIELRRRLTAENTGVRMLLTTGYSDKITVEHARELGFEDVLRKPLSFDELALSIRRILDENG